MSRFRAAAVCALVCLSSGPAWAQGTAQVPPTQGPYTRPQVNPYPRSTVSPYLNMNRGGVPALNYYNLVRPQLETQGSINLLDQRTDVLGQTLEEGRGQPLITGQASQFMTHNRYFFSFGSRATQPRAATMQPAVMTPSRSSGR